jgi:hypothetical protein
MADPPRLTAPLACATWYRESAPCCCCLLRRRRGPLTCHPRPPPRWPWVTRAATAVRVAQCVLPRRVLVPPPSPPSWPPCSTHCFECLRCVVLGACGGWVVGVGGGGGRGGCADGPSLGLCRGALYGHVCVRALDVGSTTALCGCWLCAIAMCSRRVCACVCTGQVTLLSSALEAVCDDEGDLDSHGGAAARRHPCSCARAAVGLCTVLLRLVTSARLFAKQFDDSRGLDMLEVRSVHRQWCSVSAAFFTVMFGLGSALLSAPMTVCLERSVLGSL